MDNIHIDLAHENRMSLAWEHEGARYHVWGTVLDRRGNFVIDKDGPLYKNPPLNLNPGDPGYFNTRRLDSSKGPSLRLITLAREFAREHGLVLKAIEERDRQRDEAGALRRQAEARERRRNAADALYSAMLAITAAYGPNPGAWPENVAPALHAAHKALKLAEQGS